MKRAPAPSHAGDLEIALWAGLVVEELERCAAVERLGGDPRSRLPEPLAAWGRAWRDGECSPPPERWEHELRELAQEAFLPVEVACTAFIFRVRSCELDLVWRPSPKDELEGVTHAFERGLVFTRLLKLARARASDPAGGWLQRIGSSQKGERTVRLELRKKLEERSPGLARLLLENGTGSAIRMRPIPLIED